jgi:putative DNA primase/helicase
MITETTTGGTLIPENIPEELARRPQWVCWRYEERDGKMTKVPYDPKTGLRASTTDLMAWDTCDGAVGLYKGSEGLYDGVGFVFSSGDPYAGIDLDGCRDPETGEIASWAEEILERVADASSYVEISPSGTGIHIVVEGAVRVGGMRKGNVEMYSRARFFTITGRTL